MENIKDVILRWHTKEYMTDEEEKYCEQHLNELESSDEVDYKWVSYSAIYKDNDTGKFYNAWVKRTNRGYWSDSEKVDEWCYEVVPKEITKTIYVAKENV